MPRSTLKEHVRQLHEELEAAERVDPAAREQLRALLDDIRSVLDRSTEEGEHSSQSLVNRLEEAMREFEASHPALSTTIGRVADALSSLGI